MKNTFIYILICSLFFSCEKKGDSGISMLLETEVVNLTEFDSYVVTKVLPLGKIEFIPLELSENSPVKKVNKIVCLRDRIAVLDAKGVESVLFFDYQGNFINSLSKKGMGPGEYGFLNDMDIDSLNRVHLLDLRKSKIFIYDLEGDFIEAKRFGFKTRKMISVIPEHYLFDQGTRRNTKSAKIDINARVVYWDVIKKELTPFFRFTDRIEDSENFALPQPTPFFKSGSTINYVKPFDYGIFSFSLEKKSMKLDYYVDFGALAVPEGYIEKTINVKGGKDIVREFLMSSYAHSITNVFENAEVITFNFRIGAAPYWFLRSKSDKKTIVIKIGAENINKYHFLLFPSAVTPEGSFISVLDYSMMNYLKNHVDEETDPEIRKVIDGYDPNANPIVVKWSLDVKRLIEQ